MFANYDHWGKDDLISLTHKPEPKSRGDPLKIGQLRLGFSRLADMVAASLPSADGANAVLRL